jgi:hypothetical protein
VDLSSMFAANDSASKMVGSDVVDLETCPIAETVNWINVAQTHNRTPHF